MTVEQLTQDLKNALGSRLVSVVLYGSATAGDQTKRFSNPNILVVVEKTGVDLLETVAPIVKKWRQAGNPTPLFLTPQAISTSLDVFPIEFLDMKASRRVLFGADPFAAVSIDSANLRHQLEFELRGKLMQLESRFIEAEGKESALREVVLKSVSSFTTLFRAVLRLLGESPAEKKREVWAALNTRVGVDVAALDEILALRNCQKSAVSVRELFSRLHASVQRVIEFVDKSH